MLLLRRCKTGFRKHLPINRPVPVVDAGLEHLCVAVMSSGEVTEEVSQSLMQLTHSMVAAGGTVIVPANAEWLSAVGNRQPSRVHLTNTPTLAYGQRVEKAGFHVMETPTDVNRRRR